VKNAARRDSKSKHHVKRKTVKGKKASQKKVKKSSSKKHGKKGLASSRKTRKLAQVISAM